MLIKCSECGKEISDKAVSCPNCGCPLQENKHDISKLVKCKHCGSEYFDENGYCSKCGKLQEDLLIKPNVFYESDSKTKKKKPLWIRILQFLLCFYLLCSFISCIGTTAEDSGYADTESYVETEEISSAESETVATETETEEVKEQVPTFEEYVAECQEFKYKDVLRNPSDYIGKKAKIEIEISSVHEESLLNAGKYYFGYSKSEDLDLYIGDRYGIFDNRYDTSLKLLEGDVIMVYGEIAEPEYTSSIIVNSEELFCIDMKFVELISE